jgi:T-complex protein 1 subunit eta
MLHSGAQVLLSKLLIGNLATHKFAGRGMFYGGHVPEEDMKRTMMACRDSVNALSPDVLDHCQVFEKT